MMFDDDSHRYAPDEVAITRWDVGAHVGSWRSPVVQYIVHGPDDPARGPIRLGIVAVQLVTAKGDRWYGCDRAYINSELRLVIVGHNSRDEVRQRWEVVPADKQA